MCRFHFASCLLLVFCYLVASLELTTAADVRRSAATIYSNRTTSTTAGADTSSTSLCNPPCIVGHAGASIEFDWVHVRFDTQVLATVLVQINTILNVTVTTTKYGTATGVDGPSSTGYITDITSFWNSLMDTTGVVVVNDTPTLTLKPTVYTAPGQYIIVTTVLASPTNYFNAGFLAYSADYSPVGVTTETSSATTAVVASCSEGPTTEFALTPTVTPSGFSDPYQAPVGFQQWSSMLPASLSTCSIEGFVFPAVAISAVSALTTTSTQYDDYVHSQATSSSTGKQLTPAKNSPTTPTAKPNSVPSASVVISGTTITPGAPAVTIGGTKYSLAASSPLLVVGSSTRTLAPVTGLAPVVVGGTTITPGAPAVTIGGTTYSLAASSSVLVVDGSTLTPEATLTAARSGGVGSLIWSGIGGTGAGAGATGSGAQITTFTGAANRVVGGMDWRYWMAALLIAVLAAWQ